MKKTIIAAAIFGAALSSALPAAAAGGCGPGFHPTRFGRCVPFRGPGPVVGVFYPGRGYWSDGRYWRHRERWHEGWRYR